MLTMQRSPTSQAQNLLIQPHRAQYPLPVIVPLIDRLVGAPSPGLLRLWELSDLGDHTTVTRSVYLTLAWMKSDYPSQRTSSSIVI
jgi:hypothetical protein